MNQDDVVGDVPPLDKAALIFRNDEWESYLEVVGYYFGNDFITRIA